MTHGNSATSRFARIAARLSRAILLTLLVLPLTGCVAWEIRDELRQTNVLLNSVSGTLRSVRQDLTRVNEQLDKTTTELPPMRTAVEGTAQRVEGVAPALRSIEDHLASLRRTIDNLDRAVPLPNVGGDRDGPPPPR